MARTRASAKAAGSAAERAVADYLARVLEDDRIDRRVKTGAKDRGDIGGLRHMGQRLVVEVKSVIKTALGTWVAEAEAERGNDDALAGVVWHKRVGTTDPAKWYVSMTGADFVALLSGERPQ